MMMLKMVVQAVVNGMMVLVVVRKLKQVNQEIVEHTDLEMMVVMVQVHQIIMVVAVAVLVQLVLMVLLILEMVEQEKIIVQHLEQQ